jgi:hypothetical protein
MAHVLIAQLEVRFVPLEETPAALSRGIRVLAPASIERLALVRATSWKELGVVLDAIASVERAFSKDILASLPGPPVVS